MDNADPVLDAEQRDSRNGLILLQQVLFASTIFMDLASIAFWLFRWPGYLLINAVALGLTLGYGISLLALWKETWKAATFLLFGVHLIMLSRTSPLLFPSMGLALLIFAISWIMGRKRKGV